MIQRQRVPFLMMALVTLIGAMWAGLVRVGWNLPAAARAPLGEHGPLMVVGFVGTVIGLERAVALGRKWAYAAPLLTGLGGITLLAVPGSALGPLLITSGAMVFVVVMGALARRQAGAVMLIMGLGAACWVIGNVLWLRGWPVYQVVNWWAAFPLLTIVSERLELSRFVKVSRPAFAVLYGAAALTLAGVVAAASMPLTGTRLWGAGLMGMALGLLRHDPARRRLNEKGLPRFIAVGLLLGYVWMVAAGVVFIVAGPTTSGYAYDAAYHMLFLGFIFSMIFVHAPIVFPSITGVDIPFRPLFYVHLILLHASLLWRVAGDAFAWLPWRQWGALLNAVAIVLFFLVTMLTTVSSVIGAKRARAPS